MNRVVCIKAFRSRKRKTYIDQHGDRLQSFIKSFLRDFLSPDLHTIAATYLNHQANTQDLDSWDYLDFRDALGEALDRAVGETLFAELKKTSWFDSQFVSKEDVVERCVSLLILQDWAAIS